MVVYLHKIDEEKKKNDSFLYIFYGVMWWQHTHLYETMFLLVLWDFFACIFGNVVRT